MSTNFIKDAPLPNYDQLVNCMHCGMCLPTCPTYQLTGLEINSPRGRIHMIRAVADGHLDVTERFKESIEFCLNCQACVTACPAGVQYGHLVEAAQLQIAATERIKKGKSSWRERILNWLFLDLKRLQQVTNLMRIYQSSGLEKLIKSSGVLNLFPKKVQELSSLALVIPKRKKYLVSTDVQGGENRGIKVGVLKGCVQDIFFRDVNQDTIDVLEENGYQVVVPEDDLCCGSVHGHNGDLKSANVLAKKMIDAFNREEVDYVILNSAGCGAYMKEYGALLANDLEYADRAKAFASKVKDITEFLTEKGWRSPNKVNDLNVTYHDPCHLVHTQKISKQPREIIESIKGIHYTELNEANWCCGSAGIYNIVRFDDAMRILERKMENIRASGAEWVITGNPGCMIQLMYGAKRFKMPVKVIHPVSLLNMAYKKEREVN